MDLIRVGVIRGGSNITGYQKSISDGSIILRALREHDDYEPYDILIDRNEVWHLDGVPIMPSDLTARIDIAISTIIYPLNQNGYVENIIKVLGIKCIHVPNDALRGYIPQSVQDQIKNVGVRLPEFLEINPHDRDLPKKIHQKFSPPYSLVSKDQTGSMNHISHVKNISELIEALNNENLDTHKYIIEEYIPGDKWAVTVIPNFRKSLWYTLHPVYLGTVDPAFRSGVKPSRSAQGRFASPIVRESLDLYSKLASGTINPSVPTTFVFHHVENKKPVLFRIIHRHILTGDQELLSALKESVISEGEYLDRIIKGYL
jgi:hypothetical protein